MTGQVGSMSRERNSRRNAIGSQAPNDTELELVPGPLEAYRVAEHDNNNPDLCDVVGSPALPVAECRLNHNECCLYAVSQIQEERVEAGLSVKFICPVDKVPYVCLCPIQPLEGPYYSHVVPHCGSYTQPVLVDEGRVDLFLFIRVDPCGNIGFLV